MLLLFLDKRTTTRIGISLTGNVDDRYAAYGLERTRYSNALDEDPKLFRVVKVLAALLIGC